MHLQRLSMDCVLACKVQYCNAESQECAIDSMSDNHNVNNHNNNNNNKMDYLMNNNNNNEILLTLTKA